MISFFLPCCYCCKIIIEILLCVFHCRCRLVESKRNYYLLRLYLNFFLPLLWEDYTKGCQYYNLEQQHNFITAFLSHSMKLRHANVVALTAFLYFIILVLEALLKQTKSMMTTATTATKTTARKTTT